MRELKQKLLNSLMEQEIYQRKISDQIAATAKLGIEKQVYVPVGVIVNCICRELNKIYEKLMIKLILNWMKNNKLKKQRKN